MTTTRVRQTITVLKLDRGRVPMGAEIEADDKPQLRFGRIPPTWVGCRSHGAEEPAYRAVPGREGGCEPAGACPQRRSSRVAPPEVVAEGKRFSEL